MVTIHRLPALQDNYIFVLHDSATATAAVVDPAEPWPVLDCLEQLGATLTAIFNTHHHGDHVGGNRDLLAHYPQVVIYGSVVDRGRIPGQQRFLSGGDRVTFGDRTAQVLFVPGHTRGHIAYYFLPAPGEPAGDLFCGDTLFAGGCGRLFEGTPAQMLNSLAQLRALPDATRVWCAHEYTLGNLQFALTVDSDNAALRSRCDQVTVARRQGRPTIPSTIGLEKATNPFLRWDQPPLGDPQRDGVATFAELRRLKDQF